MVGGITNPTGFLGGMMNEAISDYLSNIASEMMKFVADTMGNINEFSLSILDLPFVSSGISWCKAISLIFLIIFLLKEIFTTYMLYTSGDPDANPLDIAKRGALGVIFISCSDWMLKEFYTIGTKIAKDVGTFTETGTGSAETTLTELLGGGSIAILLVLAILILVFCIFLQMSIRGAMLSLLAIMGPLVAVFSVSGDRALFNSWIKESIIVSITQAIQTFLLLGAMSLLVQTDAITGAIFLFGWVFAAFKTPSFLRQFMSSTGLGGSMRGLGGTAKTFIFKKLMK